jgi:hypothetical protein
MFGSETSLLFETAGLIGVAFYIGSYAALQTGLISGSGYLYAGANLLASSLVLISLISSFNLWSAIIQITWIGISIYGLCRLFLIHRNLRFSEDEKVFLEAKFPLLPPVEARKLLNLGRWRELQQGATLASKGEAVSGLAYLAAGSAEIRDSGRVLARCGPGEFVGEMTILSGESASADVILSSDARLFVFDGVELRDLASKNGDIARHLEQGFLASMKDKLLAANKTLDLAAV